MAVLAPADTSICAHNCLSKLGIFAIIQFAICSSSLRFWSIRGTASKALIRRFWQITSRLLQILPRERMSNPEPLLLQSAEEYAKYLSKEYDIGDKK
jgi:hypothetical protein